eukprot:6403875-Alexandrium_andersonii.AAC.1
MARCDVVAREITWPHGLAVLLEELRERRKNSTRAMRGQEGRGCSLPRHSLPGFEAASDLAMRSRELQPHQPLLGLRAWGQRLAHELELRK